MLAGIKSLRMVDSENLSLEDGTSQFLAPRDKVMRIQSSGQFVHLVLFQQPEPEPRVRDQPVPRTQGQGQGYTVRDSSYSVADPNPDPSDLYVFGPLGSGSRSISQRHGSGSGSFYHQAKIVRKTLIPTVLLILFNFFF